MNINWRKCISGWCPLNILDLSTVTPVNGVYIIWHSGNPSRVVRVGQGDVIDRISKHRNDPEIIKYENFGLFVTWASVESRYLDGVERHLAETWNPLVGSRFPEVVPIAVNSPFA